jgi:hypothetical protein
MRAAYNADAAEAWEVEAAAWACTSHGSGGGGCACGCVFFVVVASVVEVRKKGTVGGGIALAAECVRRRSSRRAVIESRPAGEGARRARHRHEESRRASCVQRMRWNCASGQKFYLFIFLFILQNYMTF